MLAIYSIGNQEVGEWEDEAWKREEKKINMTCTQKTTTEHVEDIAEYPRRTEVQDGDMPGLCRHSPHLRQPVLAGRGKTALQILHEAKGKEDCDHDIFSPW